MSKEICTVCGREIDRRGMSGHMRTHKGKPKEGDTDGGVISYPASKTKQETVKQDISESMDAQDDKKQKKKTVASKPASSPASKPDADGQKLVKEVKKVIEKEWQGLFRD